MLALAALLLLQQPKEPPPPPPVATADTYLLVVTAKSAFVKRKETYQLFLKKLEEVRAYANHVRTERLPGDTAGWEEWTFTLAATSKLKLDVMARAFGDVKIQRFDVEVIGTAEYDEKTKTAYLKVAASGMKMKLVNRARLPKEKENPPDLVAKVRERLAAGTPECRVRGQVAADGDFLRVFLASIDPPEPPPPDPGKDPGKPPEKK